jgi:hypothetical protein
MAEKQVKPFAQTIQEIDKGRANAVLSDLMQQLVTAVVNTGTKGKLTIVVAVAPVGETNNVAVTVTPKLDAPNDYERKAVFFADDDGNLSREDPANRLAKMPLRSVGEAAV